MKRLHSCVSPESVLIDDSTDGQGQQNLDVCSSRTNRGDWNLAKIVINQSKIKWALNTFKPFKSAGTDEIVPALLQQGVEYLSPHLSYIQSLSSIWVYSQGLETGKSDVHTKARET
jgi:hypothetical protein